MPDDSPKFFHLHLVSDATGETLKTIAKAATVQYTQIRPIEHVHPLVRTKQQLAQVIRDVEAAPGIVLYTIVNHDLASKLTEACQSLKIPSVPVLDGVMNVFESYLGTSSTPTVAGQHALNAEYFRRIDALNFTMAHDDGQLPADLDQADIVVLGISRTSKTPISIYLAQRGYKTANVPIVPEIPMPRQLEQVTTALIVGLVASPERITHVRQNRVLALAADRDLEDYADRDRIEAEMIYSRRLYTRNRWPIIDVTRRSVEESAAAIVKLYQEWRSQTG